MRQALTPGDESRADANGVRQADVRAADADAMCWPTWRSRARRRCLAHLRVARATDGLETSEHERLLARVATPVVKFWNCQRAPTFVYECAAGARRQRLHHGEPDGAPVPRGAAEFDLGRHLEHDVHGRAARACSARPAAATPSSTNCGRAGASTGSTTAARTISPIGCVPDTATTATPAPSSPAWRMRCRLPRCCEHGDADAADLFVRSRLGMDGMHVFGALPSSERLGAIVERAAVIRH